jgi:hypothetical protein
MFFTAIGFNFDYFNRDGWHYKKRKVVGLERGPLSLVTTTEEQLGRNGSGSSVEIQENGRSDPPR